MSEQKRKSPLAVRPYEAADRQAIRDICLETCEDTFLRKNTEVLYLKYSDYFTDEEPDHVFVLTEDDAVRGYVLCCARPKEFRRSWKREYYKRLKPYGLMQYLLQVHTLLETRWMARFGYPAHLHIDITQSCQHMGGGTLLLDTLREKLRAEGVSGLYLGCGESNLPANAFYRKYGFRVHHHYGGRNVYTLDLKG